jgi:NAD(P)-dependent dehydrogenase (short-subunit alcohol dehydrogenase family)
MLDQVRLDNKIAVVTGSSRNLGRAMALGLADAGASVVLASPETDLLAGVAAEIEGRHGVGRALPVTVDITNAADCKRLLAQVVERFGALHVLLNCARRSSRGPGLPATGNKLKFWESDVAIWQDTVRVAVNGTFVISRTLVPQMIAQGWGRIINITTSLGTMQRQFNSPYGVTKAALEAASMIWAQDLDGTGVTVNTLTPGGSCDVDPSRKYPAEKKLLPATVMNAAAVWLASDLSDGKTRGRYVGKLWNADLSPSDAAAAALEAPVLREPND